MRKMKMLWVGLLFVGLLGGAASAADVAMTGSTTVLPIAQIVAEALAGQYAIDVSGGGSSVGVASIIDGTADIGDHSRAWKMKEIQKAAELEVVPFQWHIANDAIAPVVHPSNPIQDLTIEQLKAIYSGEIVNWSELGGNDAPVVAVGRDSSSGTFETWEKLVLGGDDPDPSVLALASNGDVASEVSMNPNAIGYVGIAYITPQLKALTVNGQEATLATALNYSYPISRPLFMSTNGFPAPGPVLDVILFVLSDEGQALVQDVGYAPIREL